MQRPPIEVGPVHPAQSDALTLMHICRLANGALSLFVLVQFVRAWAAVAREWGNAWWVPVNFFGAVWLLLTSWIFWASVGGFVALGVLGWFASWLLLRDMRKWEEWEARRRP